MSASKEQIVWPPQTTQDILNLTPRKNRTGLNPNPPLSPSPLRKTTGPSQLDPNGTTSDDSDADDEETLKLKLAQIEAKLKLKKLQKQKKKAAAAGGRNIGEQSPVRKAVVAQAVVQVPGSPTATAKTSAARAPPSPKSPSRVLLGIDKGLTGRDMSLRRAPQYRNGNRNGPLIQRKPSPPRPVKTFSERMAEERAKDRNKMERAKTIQKTRSKGFGIVDEGSSSSGSTASTVLGSNAPTSTTTTSSKTTAAQKASHTFTSVLSQFDRPIDSATAEALGLGPNADFTFRASKTLSANDNDNTDEAGFDSYSGLHLIKRTVPHTTVCRHLADKQIYKLPDLLKVVVSPDYEPPDVEGDWITLGVICAKSDPRNVGQNTQAKADGKKYMVMSITDLKWELDLFLFGGGFDRFWKIPVGTVVAILNPNILKPRQVDSGKFSLTIADEMADNVLEIGAARDLGFCKSMKRDGKPCGTWIDSRHTKFCAFHVEQTVKKSRVSRAEVNSMSSLFSPPKKGTVKPRRFFGGGGGRGGGGGGRERDDGLLREGAMADLPRRMGGAGGSVFVAPGRSTADLLDDEDYRASGFHSGKSREERMRLRLVEIAKERELTKQLLAAQGREGGLGAEYLKKRAGMTDEDKERRRVEREKNAGQKALDETLASLKSKDRTAMAVRLSPIKRKRPPPFGAAAPQPPGILVRPRSSSSTGSGADQPVTKKTRFMLSTNDAADDSDDDLDIIHE
ncbi:hypothetical protein EDC01DRAFT_707729 [Geopyxis carbonaria]|nr:hypothetical protein EDC01DRAFT_707729 [Geopyxis carbonaria]